MDLEKPIDYLQMFHELLARRAHLTAQRDQIEAEIVKTKQLIGAIYPLLPEEKQKSYQETMESIQAEPSGLQDAIRLVFSKTKDEWISLSNVRDHMIDMGFDFRRYVANPLSSIGTTLRRMVPAYVESKTFEDGTLYRRAATDVPKLPADHPIRKLKANYPKRETLGQKIGKKD